MYEDFAIYDRSGGGNDGRGCGDDKHVSGYSAPYDEGWKENVPMRTANDRTDVLTALRQGMNGDEAYASPPFVA